MITRQERGSKGHSICLLSLSLNIDQFFEENTAEYTANGAARHSYLAGEVASPACIHDTQDNLLISVYVVQQCTHTNSSCTH